MSVPQVNHAKQEMVCLYLFKGR